MRALCTRERERERDSIVEKKELRRARKMMTVRVGPPSETESLLHQNSESPLGGGFRSNVLRTHGRKLMILGAVLATVLGTLAVVGFDIGSHVSSLGGARGSALTPGVHRVNLREESTTSALGLGEGGGGEITLSTACSPVNMLSFDPGSWDNVGAKLVTKSMSRDFIFEDALEMTAVSGKCGEFSAPADVLTVNEEFGFFLYSKTTNNGKPIKDIGCESSKTDDPRCPEHSAHLEISVGGPLYLDSCTEKSTFGDISFYNRVYDGKMANFTWGSCSNDCGKTQPSGCSSPTSAESEKIEITFTLDFSGPGLNTAQFDDDEIMKLSSEIAEVVGVDASMVHISVQTEEQPTEISLGSSESNTVVKLVIKIDAIDVETEEKVHSKLTSLTETEEIAIATATGLDNVQSASGTYVEEEVLKWNAYEGPYLPCEAEVDEDGYYLVFKHDSSTGQYWSNANDDAESKHTGSNPETDYKYSRLDDVEEFGRTDEGFLQFKLEYPTLSQTNIWKQTSNPVTASGRGVDGFEAISVEANGHGTSTHSFKGLEHNSGSANFIDGTVDHGNWFFSIGAYQAWGGANNFPGPSSAVNQVKLWVKTSAKKPDTCPSPPPPPSTYSSYEILEGDVTCESKGWVTILDIDECQVAGATLSGDSNKGFRYDQPEGGYTTSSSSRTRGCTFHSGNVNNDLQFFPNAVGACGTYNFDCVCGVK